MKTGFVRMTKEHLERMKERGEDAQNFGPFLDPAKFEMWASMPYAFTFLAQGEPVAFAGLREYWPGRAEGWAMFLPEAGRHFVQLHREVMAFLNDAPVRRIEAAVEVDFERGHRWVHALGFEKETGLLKCFFMNGKDAILYARVN